jgi:hypothetical protein
MRKVRLVLIAIRALERPIEIGARCLKRLRTDRISNQGYFGGALRYVNWFTFTKTVVAGMSPTDHLGYRPAI